MKGLYTGLIFYLYYFSAIGQVVFDQLPKDFQLYPRDRNNLAEVIVSGNFNRVGYTKIAMQVLREGTLSSVVSQTIMSTASNSVFKLSSTIQAEPAEYSFRIFIYTDTDSTLVTKCERIVCGDVYIIHGQSNAVAATDLAGLYPASFDDKYMRNVSYPYDRTSADIRWYPAKQPFASVGGLGLTIQKLVLENYGIPTCVLNGGQGGATIDILSTRDPDNPANPNTFYGNLLYRAQWAGVAKQVKAIIWKQGEAEAGNGSSGYSEKFTTLYNQFREDFGDARIYVGQINILSNPQDSAASLRDFQRQTKYLFKNVESVATVGTPEYDGIHYSGAAHRQLATEQYRQIARDIYGSKDTLQINSPDIKKAFYNARKDSITLIFDDQMQMVWPKDTTLYNLSTGATAVRRQQNYFYLDGQAGLVRDGSANGNWVILSLSRPSSAKTIRYLPAFFSDNVSEFYDGPTLRNTRGMRAFSFDRIPIADALVGVTTLSAKPLSEKQIQLTWTAPAANQSQVLERADSTPAIFKKIASLDGTINSYTDTNLPNPSGTYYYRLRVYTSVSESANSNIVSARPLILGLDPTEPLVQLYPNPLATDRLLQVVADQLTFSDLLIRDMLGRIVKIWHGRATNRLVIALTDLEEGLYVAELRTANGYTLIRKVVVR